MLRLLAQASLWEDIGSISACNVLHSAILAALFSILNRRVGGEGFAALRVKIRASDLSSSRAPHRLSFNPSCSIHCRKKPRSHAKMCPIRSSVGMRESEPSNHHQQLPRAPDFSQASHSPIPISASHPWGVLFLYHHTLGRGKH